MLIEKEENDHLFTWSKIFDFDLQVQQSSQS